MHTGSKDTHALATAAGNQATWTQNLAVNMQTQANRTKDLADRMKDQADSTRDLAASAKSQSETLRLQFASSQQVIESQRASISVAPYSVDHPLSFPDPPAPPQMTFVLSLALTNNGNFVATDIHVRYEIYFSVWGQQIFTEPQERQAKLCDKPITPVRPPPIGPPPMIDIPVGKTNVRQWINGGFGIPDSDIIPWPPTEPKEKVIMPFIVGCVDYRSGAMPEPHQTGFIFEIRGGQDGLTAIRYRQEVPQNQVFIDPWGFSQGKSY
jgi:hypothetical protein